MAKSQKERMNAQIARNKKSLNADSEKRARNNYTTNKSVVRAFILDDASSKYKKSDQPDYEEDLLSFYNMLTQRVNELGLIKK